MLVIRLRRAGSKGRPLFRVVVAESSSARDGRFVEIIGHYNPRSTPETLVIDRERLDHWLSVGATASDSVRTLVARMPPADATAEPGGDGGPAKKAEPVAAAAPAAEPEAASETPVPPADESAAPAEQPAS